MYQICRRTAATGEFAYLGGAGEKKFVDTTVPAGAPQVTYQIQAVRSTAVGPWAQFNVNFGAAPAAAAGGDVERGDVAGVAEAGGVRQCGRSAG